MTLGWMFVSSLALIAVMLIVLGWWVLRRLDVVINAALIRMREHTVSVKDLVGERVDVLTEHVTEQVGARSAEVRVDVTGVGKYMEQVGVAILEKLVSERGVDADNVVPAQPVSQVVVNAPAPKATRARAGRKTP